MGFPARPTTSGTGSRPAGPPVAARSRPAPAPRRAAPGFTLVELLVVIVILALASLLVIPRLDALTDQGSDERAFRLIAGGIARAQDRALLDRRPRSLLIDLDRRLLSVEGDPDPLALPSHSRIVVERADGSVHEAGTVAIAVDAHGNIDPFELRIGTRIRALANPFTGALEPGEEFLR